jgi:hypothetical protein
MDKFIKNSQLLDSNNLHHFADLMDLELIRLAKTPEGEPILEQLDWVNPDLSPGHVSKMEKEIYPPGFHLFSDLEVPEYLKMTPNQQRLVPKPIRDKAVNEIRNLANEYLIEDDVDKYVVDGIKDVFYFILAVESSIEEKTITVEDLSVVPGRRRVNLFIALDRLYKALKPFQQEDYVIKGSARKLTSWPLIRNMIKDGWLIPVKGKRIKNIIKDDQGKIIDVVTKMESVGGEQLHQFKLKLNLPDTLPENIRKFADEGYKILKKENSLLFRGINTIKNLLPKK